jgi:hypothetical protein
MQNRSTTSTATPIDEAPDVSGIVYSYKRQECDALASYLASKGVNARAYHAGLKKDERLQLLEDWSTGKVAVVVATIAFGMGIDKADVRLPLSLLSISLEYLRKFILLVFSSDLHTADPVLQCVVHCRSDV